MTSSLNRIKRDIQELAETDELKKRMSDLERELAKCRADIKTLRSELAGTEKKLAALAAAGSKSKKLQLIEVIEELAAGMEQPMKVTEIREALMRDGRYKTKAGNFYSVIVTAMNNSPKFEKIQSGVYKIKQSD